MSEQPIDGNAAAAEDAGEAGTTSEGFGNLSVEDNPEGTTNPAELAGTAGPEDDGVASAE
jgi:hypothetical protein